MNTEEYFKMIEEEVNKHYEVAERARKMGIDPVSKVETPIAKTLAEKAVGLISTIYPQLLNSGIVERILDLEKQYGQLDTAVPFKIAEEIAREKFCKFESLLQAIEAGIRVGFSYVTLGVVSSPLEGFTELKLGKTRDGKEYFKAYFSGPIRSAGTTASCVSLFLIDYLRECFGFAKYDPSEEEVKRYITEVYDYHERVTNLQYIATEGEIEFLARNMPIEITGEPTESREVSNYKDLPRVESNFIRGGMALIFSEGLAQKAQKGFRLLKSTKNKGFQSTGWDFIDEYITKFKMAKKKSGGGDNTPVYIKDLVAGRPVYGHPSASGGFRFRYGKNRVNGFSATSVHPATMAMSDSFLSFGTQLKIEKPTKGCAISICDGMDGPIVKLKDGSVKKVSDFEEAKRLYPKTEEIIYLGDILIPFGDVLNRNYNLLKQGYVEEWWKLELEKAVGGEKSKEESNVNANKPLEKVSKINYNLPNLTCDDVSNASERVMEGEKIRKGNNVNVKTDEVIIEDEGLGGAGRGGELGGELEKAGRVEELGKIDEFNVSFEKAVEISERYKIPLHPEYIYYWGEISYDLFLGLLDWISRGEIRDGKLVLPYGKDKERFSKGKRAMELIGCEHSVTIENVVLDEMRGKSLLFNLGIDINDNIEEKVDFSVKKIKEIGGEKVLELVDGLCKFKIKDKSGTFIGARMGRPEKAKLRKLTGSPHVLFPVGKEGGRLRSVQAASDVGFVKGEFPNYYCDKCKKESVYPKCEDCGEFGKKMVYCPTCDKNYIGKCPEHEDTREYRTMKVDIRHYFDSAKKLSGMTLDDIGIVVKGVRGTSNEDHSCEHLAKGLIRAKYNLNVNKDGTIRYDMTEMPITHFKPIEIGTSVERLKELGYEKDYEGKPIENEEQLIELFPHDIILPACPSSMDEKADDVFLKISQFVDDELEKVYKLPKYFNSEIKEDVIGSFIVGIAPHICTATVGRIIGFSKTQVFLASPYFHAAMRRDCLGHDSYVSINEDGSWRIIKIGEFIEKLKPIEKIDNFGTLKKNVFDIKTLGNSGEGEINEVTKHLPRRMLRFSLEDGRKLEATENHRIYTKGNKEKRASEIKEGERFIVRYRNEVKEKDIKEIFLPEIFKDREDIMIRNIFDYLNKLEKISKHSNFAFRDSFPIKFVAKFLEKYGKSLTDLPVEARIATKRDNVELPIKINLSKELLEVIGLYISEGYARKNESEKGLFQVSISGGEEVRGFVRRAFFEHFGLKPSGESEKDIVFSSRIIYELFADYLKCGKGAKEKRIPSMFLNLKKDKIAGLLRGYYEGDGSASLSDIRVTCDSVSEGLKHDLSFVLSRFGIYTKFYEYEKEPGPKVREFYIKKGRAIPKFKITKIIIPSNFVKKFREIGFLFERKNKILEEICKSNPYGMKIESDENYAYPKVVKIEEMGEQESYCFNVLGEHNFFANELLVHNCDGDEAAAILLMDMLLNFSRKFLPAHRGGTQDAPLVLNIRIEAGEVDDQILDFETGIYPLELYEKAEQGLHSSAVEGVEFVKNRLAEGKDPFSDLKVTHSCTNINKGVNNSSYKTLPSMQEKVDAQMRLCKKIRAVDTSDVSRLIIERHFIRDTRGNLRKFSMQSFRCVGCNEIYRRTPLTGRCTKCGGKLIFTIPEGGIMKYMQPALELANKYNVSNYLKESLELTELYIQSIFGKEKEKQEALGKWFG